MAEELSGTVFSAYEGDQFSEEEKADIAAEQQESLERSIQSRGRTIAEDSRNGVIWQGN